MNRILAGLLGCAMALMLGCGGDEAPGANQYSCDSTTGGQHVCSEVVNTIDVSSVLPQVKMQCTKGGGTFGDSCNHAGAAGGCRLTVTQGGNTTTATTWYYTLTAAQVMQQCTQGGQTFVNP